MDMLTNPRFFYVLAWLLLALLAAITLWQWHRSETYKRFTLIDLVAEDGLLSGRKFFETSAFFVTSAAFITHALRNPVSEGLMLAYGGLWVVARTAGQVVHTVAAKQADTAAKELREDKQTAVDSARDAGVLR